MSSRMIRPRYWDCGFLMRKKGNPLATTRCGTCRRPETWGNGRSKIEGVLGRGHTTGPRLGRLVTLLGDFESKGKGKGPA